MDQRPHPLLRAGTGREPRAECAQYPAQHRFGGNGDNGDKSQKQHESPGSPSAAGALVEQAGNDGELGAEDRQGLGDAFGPFEEEAELVRFVIDRRYHDLRLRRRRALAGLRLRCRRAC